MKFATITVVKDEKKPPVFNIFPNPTSGKFIINCFSKQVSAILIHVVDVNGKMVYTETIQKTEDILNKEVDLSKQAKGVYFIEVIADEKRSVKKVVLN